MPLSLLGKAIHRTPLHASDGRMDKNGYACMKMPRDIRDRNPHIATRGRSDLSHVFDLDDTFTY
jgi:hypothetical protein